MSVETPEYEEFKTENDYYKLSIDQDKKPHVFLVSNLTSIEYYAMFAMNLFSTTIYNMVYLLF